MSFIRWVLADGHLLISWKCCEVYAADRASLEWIELKSQGQRRAERRGRMVTDSEMSRVLRGVDGHHFLVVSLSLLLSHKACKRVVAEGHVLFHFRGVEVVKAP